MLKDDEVRKEFMTFIATDEISQGAFYTVGWQMASTIERAVSRCRRGSACPPIPVARRLHRHCEHAIVIP